MSDKLLKAKEREKILKEFFNALALKYEIELKLRKKK